MCACRAFNGSLSVRDRAVLAAVEVGRVEITSGSEPDLFIDGLCFCDQETSRRLALEGLIEAVANSCRRSRAAAVRTPVGADPLAAARAPRIGAAVERTASSSAVAA